MLNLLAVILQDVDATGSSAVAGGAAVLVMILWLAVTVLLIAAMWKVFVKAGKPGWAAIVPIYNVIVLLEITGKPLWWIILMFIPFVNIIVGVMLMLSLAQNFGKSVGFGIGLLLLPFVFFPMLAWGDSRYQPQVARLA